MRTADTLPTSALWTATNEALCQGRWSVARRMCEVLSRRNDFADKLSHVSAYLTALALRGECRALDAGFRQLLQDRIDAVNARADRNSDQTAALCRAVTCAVDEIKDTRASGLLDASNWLLIVEAHAADAGVSESLLADTLTKGGFPCPVADEPAAFLADHIVFVSIAS